MHNKENMKPLDSRTKSGKIIDSIIARLDCDCIKSNLSDTDYLPTDYELHFERKRWADKYNPDDDTIIVLLGRWVHENFCMKYKNIISCAHPASLFGYVNTNIYVNRAVQEINNKINKL